MKNYFHKKELPHVIFFKLIALLSLGACGGAVVEALRYKPEGREIDSRWCNWNFLLT
jgi:hypothetical protein